MPQWTARQLAWTLLLLIVAGCFGSAWAISRAVTLPSDEEFDVIAWEVRHFPAKWLYLAGRYVRGGLSSAEEEERLGRYLALTAKIRAVQLEQPTDEKRLTALLRERDSLENDVEAIIEGRVTAVLEEAGLDASIPLFPNARFVFPPVDFELDQPLRVMSVSHRDRIELIRRRPLRQGLTLEDVVEVELGIESAGDRSALVESVAGSATYPSIVAPRSDYQQLVETVAHEWAHHYLFFQPLGQRIFSSVELQTLNETVADLVGQELGSLTVERYPLSPATVAELEGPRPDQPEVDIDGVLRSLRLDVERLLGEGRVEDAEELMERRRQELAEQGVEFRRINQAFFASRSLYANTAASIDPLGLKLAALREESPSVNEFLRTAADLTSAEDLDRLLAGAAAPS